MLWHMLLHFAPAAGAAFGVWWLARRAGQLSQPERARWLPLEHALGTDEVRRDRLVRAQLAAMPAWRRKLVTVSLAAIIGIAIGLPLATAILAIQSTGIAGILDGVHHSEGAKP
ncbi:MAG TPA: hypothetical protein VGM37_06110 [Armatimonadota bacterium]|jgi:ABC-type antimicrobial peptide transport system permease subunit